MYASDQLPPDPHYVGAGGRRLSQNAATALVGGERPFRRPFVGADPKLGHDVVYHSEAELLRAEEDRAHTHQFLSPRGRARFAAQQLQTARLRHGLRPGTQAAQQAQAIEAATDGGKSGWRPAEGT